MTCNLTLSATLQCQIFFYGLCARHLGNAEAHVSSDVFSQIYYREVYPTFKTKTTIT